MNEIYPKELELKHENSECDKNASYLDLQLDVVNQEIVTSLYDKRDDFPFKIVNFPDLSGNIHWIIWCFHSTNTPVCQGMC